MAMDKIFLQDLADGLARRKSISKKDAEAFIRNVFDIIGQNLLADQLVKVKGFGTFKMITVDSRESINVNTGERITIDSHTKITFTPDAILRDRVNRPFADFETVVLNDDTKTEDMEALTAPFLAAEQKAEEKVEVKEVVQEEVKEEPVVEPTPIAEEPIAEPVIETGTETGTKTKTKTNARPEGALSPSEVIKRTKTQTKTKTEEKKPGEKSGSCWKWMFWILLLFVILLVAAYFLYEKGYLNLPKEEPVAENSVVQVEKPDTTAVEEVAEDSVEIQAEEVKEEKPVQNLEELIAQYPQFENGDYWIVGTKAIHVIEKGDDFSKLAQKYYEDKSLISYIIKYNKFKDPSHIFVGAEVKIPELVKRGE